MDPQSQVPTQDQNQIDPVAVLNYIQEAGKTEPIIRLTLDNAMKSAFIDKQNELIQRMDRMLAEQQSTEKTKLKEVKPS